MRHFQFKEHFQKTASDCGGRKPKLPCLLILPEFVVQENKNDDIHKADRQISRFSDNTT